MFKKKFDKINFNKLMKDEKMIDNYHFSIYDKYLRKRASKQYVFYKYRIDTTNCFFLITKPLGSNDPKDTTLDVMYKNVWNSFKVDEIDLQAFRQLVVVSMEYIEKTANFDEVCTKVYKAIDKELDILAYMPNKD